MTSFKGDGGIGEKTLLGPTWFGDEEGVELMKDQ